MDEKAIAEKLQSFDISQIALSDLTSYAITFCKNVLIALAILMIGRFLIKRIQLLVRKIMERRQVEPSLNSFLDSLITITLNFVLGIAVIGVLGIETSSFVALFASAGVAVGMALSGTLQNFAGGVMILIFKPYKVGDFIEAAGFAGTVREIQIFNTILRTKDNQTIIIPNNNLSTGSMRNYSTAPERRIDLAVEVAYGSNVQEVRQILAEIINQDERILKEGDFAPAIPMIKMGSSSIVLEMRMWVESANYWPVNFETIEKVYTTLTERGIDIPFQQVDIHVKEAKKNK